MSSTYEYTPLESDDAIRLLDLSPPSPGNPEELHCRIRSTTLKDTAKTFEALSYTWGRDGNVKTIKCNDNNALLQISSNCYEALRCLRRQGEYRTLWVDAICIHQANDSERSAQVKIMGDIFTKARETVVFLGESNPRVERLFWHMSSERLLLPNMQDYEAHGEAIDEIERLFKRPWFDRVWVIQEVVNAESVVFTCGSHSAVFSELHDCLHGHIGERKLLSPPAPISIWCERFSVDPHDLEVIPVMHLFMLLSQTGLCESTDPRDRVLALIPLLRAPPPEIKDLIDYHLSPDDLFWKLAVVLLQNGGLSLFWMIRYPRRDNDRGTPSWVPDWADNTDRSLVIPLIQEFLDSYAPNVGYRDFALSNNSSSALPLLLTVKGREYGYIQEVGPILFTRKYDYTTRIAAVNALLDQLPYESREPNFGSYSESMINAISDMVEDDMLNLLRGRPDTTSGVDHDVSSRIEIACFNSRLFMTESNKIGLCPREAQPGDLVCLIKGAPAACILRQKDNHQYTIITGDCVLQEMELAYTYHDTKECINTWDYMNKYEFPEESMREFTIC
ncbi:hypothetical protein ANO14919_053450 [Xylariales sp. No.14919]|nr:hypothetical protein ANO14919_053450 [Xylariales sp. No.14919]